MQAGADSGAKAGAAAGATGEGAETASDATANAGATSVAVTVSCLAKVPRRSFIYQIICELVWTPLRRPCLTFEVELCMVYYWIVFWGRLGIWVWGSLRNGCLGSVLLVLHASQDSNQHIYGDP